MSETRAFPDLSTAQHRRGGVPRSALRQAYAQFNLVRVLAAVLLLALWVSPLRSETAPGYARDLAVWTAVVYGLVAIALWLHARRALSTPIERTALTGLVLDIAALSLMTHTLGGPGSGVVLLLISSLIAHALLLPSPLALVGGASGALLLLVDYFVADQVGSGVARDLTQTGLYGASYLIAALIGQWLGSRFRQSEALVEQRSVDLANLAQLHELILQRMRTGVLVIDDNGHVRTMNESAWYLIGMPSRRRRDLADLSPKLNVRFRSWRDSASQDNEPLVLGAGLPAVVPRFAKLDADESGATLAFIEDESMVARRAEELTLASLGRMAASIAHEIRNPLQAIAHARQLLAEGDSNPGDRRLIDIIGTNVQRLNTIIESVLAVSRRERTAPAHIDLCTFVREFVDEFTQSQPRPAPRIDVMTPNRAVHALFDPGQLQQILWNLTQNALRYGRRGAEPALITIRVATRDGDLGPILDVSDQGPGIPARDEGQLFQPFFTTRHDGTGLGLYLARQLAESNLADLEYVPVPTGGACFRLSMTTPRMEAVRTTDSAR